MTPARKRKATPKARPLPTKQEFERAQSAPKDFPRPMGVPCVDSPDGMNWTRRDSGDAPPGTRHSLTITEDGGPGVWTMAYAAPPSLWAEDVKATRYRCASLLLKLARQIRRVAYRVAP